MTMPAARQSRSTLARRALLLVLSLGLLAQIVLGLYALDELSRSQPASSGLTGSPGHLRDLPALRRDGGCRVLAVRPGSPAAAVGLAGGDLITEWQGTLIAAQPDAWFKALREATPGTRLALVWERQGRVLSGEIRFDAASAEAHPRPLRLWLIYAPLLLPPLLLLLIGALIGLLRPLDPAAWAVALRLLG
ncbi:PDZ domain-containing protein, partial [bacterium]|nr:PDZ domain-containing protein [bacterium]